jgi:hypothetical protein
LGNFEQNGVQHRRACHVPRPTLTGPAAQEWPKQHPNVSLKDSLALGVIVTKLSGTRRGYIVKLRDTEHELKVAARSIGTPEHMVGPASAENVDSDRYYEDASEYSDESDSAAESDDAVDDEATHGNSLKSLSADKGTFCEGLLDDPQYRDFPSYEIGKRGHIKLEDSMDPTTCLPYLLAFLPLAHISSCFPDVRKDLQLHGEKGVTELTDGLLLGFMAILMLMSLVNLSSRQEYWDEENGLARTDLFHEVMSWHAFDHLLAVLKDNLPRYQAGALLPDSRLASANDRLRAVRMLWNRMWEVARRVYSAGSLLVPDELMIKWTGPGIHLTHMPRKPCLLGICLKIVCDGYSGEMLSGEFVEEAEVLAEKSFVKSGKAAGCTARILAPRQN